MEYNGYLFAHFTGEGEVGEQIYFSISKDGLFWEDLNNGNPVIVSDICEKGLRDPFILRNKIDNKFYIISTDLRIASGKGWGVAQYEGSRKIMVTSSEDLINWTPLQGIELALFDAGCLWAPEAVYDKKEDNYLVFFASMIKKPGEEHHKQRIYGTRTRDFLNYSQPFLYIEKENHVIDTTIIEKDDKYFRFSKDETTKNIVADMGSDVGSKDFTKIDIPVLEKLFGVEGPAIFKFNDRDEYCLIVDQFATDGGYLPIVTSDIESGDFRILNKDEYNMGMTKKRHGSVINITENEYLTLKERFR